MNITFFRLAIACLCGLIITSIALITGWDQTAQSIMMWRQRYTQYDLDNINKAIAAYRLKKHILPQTLSQLEFTEDNKLYSVDEKGIIRDPWFKPYLYKVQGSHYVVVSYGQDGKPGGTGLDMDLTSDNPRPPGSGLTFILFLTDSATRGMVTTACICGTIVFALCLMIVKPKPPARQDMPVLIIGLLILLGAAAFITTFITAFHVPSGH
jgi:hypothetical protein